MHRHGIAVTEFVKVDTEEDVHAAISKFGLPLLLKARRHSYDGRGNYVLKSVDAITEGMKKLGGSDLYAEKFVPFVKELSVMVAVHNSESGKFGNCFPVVETIHSDNICNFVLAPAPVSAEIRAAAKKVAKHAATSFGSLGIFGVEMFLLGKKPII